MFKKEDYTSQYGSKEFWNEIYTKELEIFTDSDVTPKKDGVQKYIINWLLHQYKNNRDIHIIDLGCGAGAFLFDLAINGFGTLIGIDYSRNAVALTNSVIQKKSYDMYCIELDLTNVMECKRLGIFDIVHDKGTFDDISQRTENTKEMQRMYLKTVRNLMSKESIFIITSFCWTEDELVQLLSKQFVKDCKIPITGKFSKDINKLVTILVFRVK
ncbi:EEF1A lysine methyltransferase 2-like [Teleopsis dalmanni]|uniref:EEF1A lysine methyltransferase 2-like n=1 Tax=Teleopsis dalmanni TaxID=139649 RepID=UPI0018CF533A|nr:EEF1A lysine methyltransferase 2-like [Teleopsis dalmanni]